MTTRERRRLRRECLEYARRYLGTPTLTREMADLARGYADGFTEYPYPTSSSVEVGGPLHGLGEWLRPFRKPPLSA